MDHQNPLKQFFRQYKLFIRLPSGTSYYPSGSIKFTDSGEVGILPMTGKDELILKNPDALLNGEAMVEVIRSCAPEIRDPKVLLTNDIDALITAIRLATYNDKLETEISCPNCSHENKFKMDLQYSLDHMSYLEPEYQVMLDSGLVVTVRPYRFPEMLKGLHSQFEQGKIARLLEDKTITDEDKVKIFGGAFNQMSNITFELLASAIVKVSSQDNTVNVVDRKHIAEFLQNIDKKNVDKISDLIKEINQIGIKREFHASCEKCNHTWTTDIDFNPVNFS